MDEVKPDLGCARCRAFPIDLPIIGQSLARHVIVRRCPVCSTYWIETERYSVPVTAEDAAREAPDVPLPE